jgi:glycerophosphoryl diester phosphodiesterase
MKLISHRGASARLPENTIAAFELAKKAGFEMFETDVQLTKDGILVCCHDYTLKRMANANVKVAELTLQELKTYNAAEYFKNYGEKLSVPTLEEVIDCLGKEAKIYIELKNKNNIYPDIAEKVSGFIKTKKLNYENIFVSSFHHPTLENLKTLNPCINTGLLLKKGQTENSIQKALNLKAVGIIIHFADACHSLSDNAHANSLKILAYTVNDTGTIKKLHTLGIDAVFTDRIDLECADN